jgi:hypothetical protein
VPLFHVQGFSRRGPLAEASAVSFDTGSIELKGFLVKVGLCEDSKFGSDSWRGKGLSNVRFDLSRTGDACLARLCKHKIGRRVILHILVAGFKPEP